MNIRTATATVGKHGNQATYDIKGNLITTIAGAGSADYGDAKNHNSIHQSYDVSPFNLAALADGYNFSSYPSVDNSQANTNIKKYFEVRPAILSK